MNVRRLNAAWWILVVIAIAVGAWLLRFSIYD